MNSQNNPMVDTKMQKYINLGKSRIVTSSCAKIGFKSKVNNDDDGYDDGGWGVIENTSSDKEKELESLRSQMSAKKDRDMVSPSTSSSSQQIDGNERDLFIPIFAVISLLGLFGAYGYEMLRLYSRGELYLPGM